MAKLNGTILLVDDDQDVLYTARVLLKQYFTNVVTESTPVEIAKHLKKSPPDVVVLDMNFASGDTSGADGLKFLRRVREVAPQVKIVMHTAYGDISLAVEAMKEGATDFITKPWEKEKFVATLKNVYQLGKQERELTTLKSREKTLRKDLDQPFGEMISKSSAMRGVFDTIRKVARTDANVLILGENGTGKELVARELHRQSTRSGEHFIKVDLGALSDSLFESELFGVMKGAFTDAKEDRAGRFEVASGGTLFLDEIGNLPPSLQVKLLSVLQNREIVRLGANIPTPIDVRLLCATNMPISEMGDEGVFRQDLLYRINTVEIHLPPLRKRLDDIPLLANHFLKTYAHKYHKPELTIADQTISHLQNYSWPGNIRELQHAVERAVILAEGPVLLPDDFVLKAHRGTDNQVVSTTTVNLEAIEKETIRKAIQKNQGNLSSAAKELGMGRSTLYRKMKKYGL
ncbi:MAG TPA: sigma-54-dependent Fis family transcriptional regulator [Cytophagales bacterium]|nr:sigma-54-dependent Fis family transcriptional regulator [Cytophagales bacterium]HAA19341.1 sigma-54-dependent Fis family transcriptional regulator [Cytophagales bacterium]HAP58165.1 sigma-54-dependent Fis family transcriptional regulator [Cytophagales bacterium]